MKNKISRILGVGLTIAMLASLLTVGAPARPVSAGTLEWTTESLPGTVVSTSTTNSATVFDYAVGSDNGSTIYAVTGTPHVYKSTNGGSSWTRKTLGSFALGTNLPSMRFVAVAPDNTNIVAIGYSSGQVNSIAVTAAGTAWTVRPTVTVAGTGNASATAYLTGASVNATSVTIGAGGSGYTIAPAVVISNASGDTTGSGAAATATVTAGAVTAITFTSAGSLYTGPPTITFAGGGGHGARATVRLLQTTVATIEVSAGGAGYDPLNLPAIIFTRGTGDTTGTGATATATVAAAPAVYISTNGAATGEADSWTSADVITNGISNLLALRDLAISPAVSGVRHVAVSGNRTGNLAGIYTLNLGGTIASWTDATAFTGGVLGGSSMAQALAFSPNWLADRVLVAITSNAGGSSFLNVGRFLTATTGAWNASSDFTEFTGAGTANGLISTGGVPLSATIALAPTYLGADPGSRISFVSIDVGADTGSGVFRMEDAKRKGVELTDIRFRSVAYKTGQLIAGRADSNNVYSTTNPLATTPTVTDITDQFQRPSGGVGAVAKNTKVAFSGSNVIAATEGNEAAFSRSTDNGATFNDVSFIGTSATNIADIAVAADGSLLYMVSNDGTDTSVLVKIGTTWERVASIVANAGPFVIRIAPDNKNAVYLVNTTTTKLYFSDDGGQKKWASRISNETITDLAVESAQVVYYVSGLNVRKSTNAGFLWGDPAVAAFTSGTGLAIDSLGRNNLLVTNDSGVVATSTDGGATFTRLSTLSGAGKVKATATTLATKDLVYAAGDAFSDAADNVIYRYEIGSVAPDNIWKKIGTITVTGTADFTGIVLKGGVLYAIAYDSVDGSSTLYRSLNPTVADTSVVFDSFKGAFPDATAPAAGADGRNSSLRISTTTAGNKLWAVDQDFVIGEESGDSTVSTNDELYSFTDTLSLATAAPSVTSPAAGAVIAVNPVSGIPFAITLAWARPSLATAYQVEIALDSRFTQTVTLFAVVPTDPAITPVTTTIAPALINPGTTYSWRVRATAPVDSPWSTTRSFSIGSLDKPFALASPAVGATGVGLKPILTWSAYTGALWYEVTLSEDPSFAIPEWSHNVYQLFFGVDEPMKYGTTYYWRVRGVTAEPFVKGTKVITPAGPWATGAFTTLAEPVKAEPPVIVVEKPAPPAEIKIVEVPKEVLVQQPIPSWMLLTIIVIGAVLVIALIVLIVRTRRVA